MTEKEFTRLYDTYRGRVVRVCLRILQNTADAEDCTQEVFIRLLSHYKQFEGRSHISTWLYRIAVNASLMRLRSQRRRTALSVECAEEDFSDRGRKAGAMSRALRVCEATVRLSQKDRNILELHHVGGFTAEELAKMQGTSVSAMKTRLLRGRRRMKALLLGLPMKEGSRYYESVRR